MTDDRGKEKKDELLKLLEEAQEESSAVRSEAQVLVESSSLSRDVAECLRSCIAAASDDSVLDARSWDQLIAAWKAHNSAARLAHRALVSGQSFAVTAQATTVTTSVTISKYYGGSSETSWLRTSLRPAAKKLDAVLQSRPLFSEIQGALIRLRLNQGAGTGRDPIGLLEDSRLALGRPPGDDSSPVAVLIGLRESFRAVLAQLLARRPRQEKTPHDRDKIMSIGMQCGRTELAAGHFERMGVDAENLFGLLSQAKQRHFSREELVEIYNGGLLLLKTFLESLDEYRLPR